MSVFDSMTAQEKAMLETEQDKMMREGYPEETKRRYVNAIADADHWVQGKILLAKYYVSILMVFLNMSAY